MASVNIDNDICINVGDDDASTNTCTAMAICLDNNNVRLDKDKEYHLFLSHCNEDLEYVRPILTILEDEYNLKCCIDSRDFLLGYPTMKNIDYAIRESMGTVWFFTPKFLQSSFCLHEIDIAYTLYGEGLSRVIPVILKPCKVPEYIQRLNYIEDASIEVIAEKIHQSLFSNVNDLSRYMPSDEVAGKMKISGNKFVLFTASDMSSESHEFLTKNQKLKCQEVGIDISQEKEDHFRLVLEMLQSIPIRWGCSSSAPTNTYFFCISFIVSTFLSVFITKFCILYKLIMIGKDPDVYNDYHNQSYDLTGLCTFLGCLLGGTFIANLWYVYRRMYFRPKLLKETLAYISLINISAVEQHKCVFYPLNLDLYKGLGCLKYDIEDCKEYIEENHDDWKLCCNDPDNGNNFELYWNKQLYCHSIYFALLALDLLDTCEEERHIVKGGVLCFCQYVESLLLPKLKKKEEGKPISKLEINVLSRFWNRAKYEEGFTSNGEDKLSQNEIIPEENKHIEDFEMENISNKSTKC